jgi:hypothetical protein
MSRTKRTSKRMARKTAVPMAGVVGVVSLVLAGSASAGTDESAADMPSGAIAPHQEITLSEEEIADVSLATFHAFDKEGVATSRRFKVARCTGCGGCAGSCVRCRRCGSCGCRF